MLFVLVSAANMVPVVLLKMEDSIARATLDGLASDARQISMTAWSINAKMGQHVLMLSRPTDVFVGLALEDAIVKQTWMTVPAGLVYMAEIALI